MLSSYVLDQTWIFSGMAARQNPRRTAPAPDRWRYRGPQDGSENFLALIFEECQQSFTTVNAAWFPVSQGFYSWNGASFVPVCMMRLRHGVAGLEAEESAIGYLLADTWSCC